MITTTFKVLHELIFWTAVLAVSIPLVLPFKLIMLGLNKMFPSKDD